MNEMCKRKTMKRDQYMATTAAATTIRSLWPISLFFRMHLKPEAKQRNMSIFEPQRQQHQQQRLLVFRACEVTLVIHTSHLIVPWIIIIIKNVRRLLTLYSIRLIWQHTRTLICARFFSLCLWMWMCVRAHKFKNKLLASVRLLSSVYLNYSEKKFSLSTYPCLCESIQLTFNRWSKLVLFPANVKIKWKTTLAHSFIRLFVY